MRSLLSKKLPTVSDPYADFLHIQNNKGLQRTLYDLDALTPHTLSWQGKAYRHFLSNDYLNLSAHPALLQRGNEWAKIYGVGARASRLVCGNLKVESDLEKRLADFLGYESVLIVGSGFLLNGTVLPALLDVSVLGQAPLVFTDRLNHRSLHDGCRVGSIHEIRYRHNDMEHLQSLLEEHAASPAPRFVVTESIFSMDGDVADLARLTELKRHYPFTLIVDDAHAVGVCGAQGEGIAPAFDGVDITVGTFSKAFGSYGGYVACRGSIREYLINRCAGVMYSTAPSPFVLGAIDAALDLMPTLGDARAQIVQRAEQLRAGVRAQGFSTLASSTHIVPMVMGSPEETLRAADVLRTQGFFALPMRPPTVPVGTSRLRFSVSSAHTDTDVSDLLRAIRDVRA